MSWLSNIKIFRKDPEDKSSAVRYELTAHIDDIANSITRWDIEGKVVDRVVRMMSDKVYEKYANDIIDSINREDLQLMVKDKFKEMSRERIFGINKDRNE